MTGRITPVLDGRFLRHTYAGPIQGTGRHGEELLDFNAVTRTYRSSRVDGFHRNYVVKVSQGGATDRGLETHSEYDVGESQPRWGRKTEYELVDEDHPTTTAYHISPEGDEVQAVETTCVRIQPGHIGSQGDRNFGEQGAVREAMHSALTSAAPTKP